MKGVSTYIAVTLLIAATVAIATLFSGWITTLTQAQTQTVANKTKAGIDCTRANVNIDEVYLDLTANKARINVRNSGFFDDLIISAVVITANGNVATNLTAFPIKLSQGDAASIELNTSGIITACGNFSQAIVATQCVSREFDGTPKNC